MVVLAPKNKHIFECFSAKTTSFSQLFFSNVVGTAINNLAKYMDENKTLCLEECYKVDPWLPSELFKTATSHFL